jgi:DNA-directed RNA polymerase subunit RPC12/RpoP
MDTRADPGGGGKVPCSNAPLQLLEGHVRQCVHCSRWFKSRQATRAHLKWCQSWIDRREVSRMQRVYTCADCGDQSTNPTICSKCGGRTWVDPPRE